jgi:hypothetical protein
VSQTAFIRALKRADLAEVMAGLGRYTSKRDDRPWCNPATWLNQDRWKDEPALPPLRGIVGRNDSIGAVTDRLLDQMEADND